MLVKALVLALYFIIVLVLGFIARRRLRETPGDYFLAGRTFGTFILICTMAATNFSAFTVFGASGAGYRDGLAFFPIMAFGTGFMALTFWLIGRKAWQLGKIHGLITPAELIGKVYGHNGLSILFALVMVVFTVPYIALQPMAGGLVLDELFGIGRVWGAVIVTAIILAYVLRGGMRAVAWTDVFQGLLMLVLMIAAMLMVAAHFGGISRATSDVMRESPELFARPGGQGQYSIAIWFSFLMLWFFCDPMFPQLFQRFYAARSERSLARTMLLYPAICTVVFAMPVLLGLFGRLYDPSLTGKDADNIVPMLASAIGGEFMGTLILAAGLAALMSTMDSQLLTLSSIFTRDVYPAIRRGDASPIVSRIFVVALAAAGLLLAVTVDASILDLGLSAFTGLAVLFPAVFFGLYLKNPSPAAAIGSIVVGEALVAAYLFKLLPAFGFLPAVPVIVAAILTYMIIQLLTCRIHFPRVTLRDALYTSAFLLVFLLALDFWNWDKTTPLLWGFPLWAWYFIGLSGVQTVVMYFWVRRK